MKRLSYLSEAAADLRGIQRYLRREAGTDVARETVETIRARCRRIAELPGLLGTERPDLGAEVRSTPQGNYVIFFRYGANTVEIVNILHASRDIDGYFSA